MSFALALTASATQLLDRNLVYSSPFNGHPQVSLRLVGVINGLLTYLQFARDTKTIQKRHIQHAKRQMANSTGYTNEAYPTFYGQDFSNVIITLVSLYFSLISPTQSPYVWSAGIDFTHRGKSHI